MWFEVRGWQEEESLDCINHLKISPTIWHKAGRGAGEAIAVRLGTGTWNCHSHHHHHRHQDLTLLWHHHYHLYHWEGSQPLLSFHRQIFVKIIPAPWEPETLFGLRCFYCLLFHQPLFTSLLLLYISLRLSLHGPQADNLCTNWIYLIATSSRCSSLSDYINASVFSWPPLANVSSEVIKSHIVRSTDIAGSTTFTSQIFKLFLTKYCPHPMTPFQPQHKDQQQLRDQEDHLLSRCRALSATRMDALEAGNQLGAIHCSGKRMIKI